MQSRLAATRSGARFLLKKKGQSPQYHALKTQTRGAILTEYVQFVHGIVSGLGKRMWMWGDGLLKRPEMLAGVPKDVVICNWQYAPDAAPETTQTLLNAGFDVMLCSGLTTYDQTLCPGERFSLQNVRALQQQVVSQQQAMEEKSTPRGRVLGHLGTIWTPVRFIANSLWMCLDGVCGIYQHGPDVDMTARVREFATDFYGLIGSDLDRFAVVGIHSLNGVPMRDEWLAVLQLRDLPPALLQSVRASSLAWTQAARELAALSPMVRRHRSDFEAFTLMIDLLAGVYDAAVKVADEAPLSVLERAATRAHALAERIDQQWDLERAGDDSRKFTAPVPSFQLDHLVPLVSRWADAISSHAAGVPVTAEIGPRETVMRAMEIV